MDWNEHFETVFFNTWQKAGLPDHQDFLAEYIDTRERVDFEDVKIEHAKDDLTTPTPNQLRSVYGFGALIGKVYSKMLGLTEAKTLHVRDWCGRFNLGISVFDYVCDETDIGIDKVTSLKVFKPFINRDHSKDHSLSPIEEYLSNLTKGVLQDIKKETFEEPDSIFNLLKQLFDAQIFISKAKLASTTNLNEIRSALQMKSAGPFEVMAKYAARSDSRNKQILIGEMGKSIGNCYWLIDDAKDVWVDLKARQWNLFSYLAVLQDPLIFAKDFDESINDRLLMIWKQSNHAENISNQIIGSLVQSTHKLELSKKVERHTLGLISASLWQWIKY